MNETNEFDAARLRRVVNLVGLESVVPDDDKTLLGCLGSVLGMVAHEIEKLHVSRNTWSSIESAPKDDKQILTFSRELNGHLIGGKDEWYQTSFWSQHFQCYVGWPMSFQPTHWQSLPLPPAAE